ncbi:MAG TPA: YdcF family protein [Rickettsiales bacterium]|nr:YdcF family protein [Rickettsiales bacterium]
MPMKRALLFFLLLITLLWGIGFCAFVAMIPQSPGNNTVHTDAIVVLTGGNLRLESGFELLAQGRAPKMFISGVEPGVTLASLLRKHPYRDYASRIEPGSVTLGYKARSTIGNASEIAEWAKTEHVESILLVTGNYHIPRSVHEIHEAAPNLILLPEPVFTRNFQDDKWWQSWQSAKVILSEYHKYIASLFLSFLR